MKGRGSAETLRWLRASPTRTYPHVRTRERPEHLNGPGSTRFWAQISKSKARLELYAVGLWLASSQRHDRAAYGTRLAEVWRAAALGHGLATPEGTQQSEAKGIAEQACARAGVRRASCATRAAAVAHPNSFSMEEHPSKFSKIERRAGRGRPSRSPGTWCALHTIGCTPHQLALARMFGPSSTRFES